MSDTVPFTEGQRWISTSEPELGLGVIVSYDNRRVEIAFSTHATTRTYAAADAPLQRIIFSPGNTIRTVDGLQYTVSAIEENNGYISYLCDNQRIPEEHLDDTLSFAGPQQRLSTGIADGIHAFTLRSKFVNFKAEITASEIRGFCGGRIDLIPHQLYIAAQATRHANIRVLLADETGLGKTIEACLILHRLLLTGQVSRVLIIVPESLVHQWFVELLRRFNLTFRLLTEDTLPDSFPEEYFTEDQLWLCSDSIIDHNPPAVTALKTSAWDMCIIDEVHHVARDHVLYSLLHTFSSSVSSLVLLSATPEQFGREAHFARLRILDPHRYADPEPLETEARRLQLVSDSIESVKKTGNGTVNNDTLIPLTNECHRFLSERMRQKGSDAPGQLPHSLSITQLIDLFGAGRCYFRNTRSTISGFPERKASVVALEKKDDTNPIPSWIASFIKSDPHRKTLIITSSVVSALSLREELRKVTSIDIGIFHEEMNLLQRDRQAAWFAEQDGPPVLICSETGSEGRNFQFCSDLILLNLPWNPELLEQRIGRLDRIGQKKTITIHVPVVSGSSDEIICRWYHEGAGLFEHNVPAAATVFDEMKERLEACTHTPSPSIEINGIIEDTRQRIVMLNRELYRHRDYLLEFASNNTPVAQTMIASINETADSRKAETIMKKLFKHFGITLEEAGDHRFSMNTDYCSDHAFPLPRAKHPVITWDRSTACAHEHIEFMTVDHPMLNGALDLFLSSPYGTSAFALWNDLTTSELLLETLYVAECIAPPAVRLHRFFTATPLRTVLNHHETPVTDKYPQTLLKKYCKNGPVNKLVKQKKLIQETFPRLAKASKIHAENRAAGLVASAKVQMHREFSEERTRLKTLHAQGAPITSEEIALLDDEEKRIDSLLSSVRTRCDALRLIWRGPVKGE